MTSLHTDLDLTDAVEAAARHHWEHRNPALAPWDDVVTANPALAHDIREHVLPAVTAAAPVIATAAIARAALDEPATCDHERAARYLATASTLTGVEARNLIDALTPPTLPSVEDVARALWELDEQEAETTGGALGLPWSALDSLTQGTYRADAEDLLALLPGRTQAEVKAEAWDEVADYLDRTNAPSLAEAARRDNPYREEADDDR